MDDATIGESIAAHLQQTHAAERAKSGELRTLADVVGVAPIRTAMLAHVDQARRHGDRIEARLAELGQPTSMRLLAQTFGATVPKVVVDRIRPGDTCACLRDAVAATSGEIAGYLLLEAEAIRAGDDSTAVLAAELGAEEAAMRDELMTYWNQAVEEQVTHLARRADGRSKMRVAHELLVDRLQDAQALERNAGVMLTTVIAAIDDGEARERVDDHSAATARQGDALVQRLRDLGSRPSLRKRAQGFTVAAVKGPINLVRGERAARAMRDIYVVEHLELVAYAELEVLAARCGDDITLQLARTHAAEERSMSSWLEREAGSFLLETMEREA